MRERETKRENTVICIIPKYVPLWLLLVDIIRQNVSGRIDGTLTDSLYVSIYKIIVSLSQASLK